MIALDTEATGLDLFHGARPYLVTVCLADSTQKWWEWQVDPLTREVSVDRGDLAEILDLIESEDRLVLQNSKYDGHALRLTARDFGIRLEWPWHKTDDTLIASHLLASGLPHNLTDLAMQYLGVNIEPYEQRLEEAVRKARSIVQQARLKVKRGKADAREKDIARWKIAEEGLEDMPSAKSGGKQQKIWKSDAWLPRAMIEYGIVSADEYPTWQAVCAEYANVDSESTLMLWRGVPNRYQGMEADLKRQHMWEIYQEQMKLPQCFERMENRGVTVILANAAELKSSYVEKIEECSNECVRLSGGRLKVLPNGVTDELRSVIRDHFGLESPKTTDTGRDSYAKDVIEHWVMTLPHDSDAWRFISNYQAAKKRQTALGYLESYERYWIEIGGGFARLHMSLNQTGTATTRLSCSNPNGQQVSSQELEDDEGEKRSTRHMFGPAPGREWWSFDFENIELRIPAYRSGEKEMIALFERPDEPPYYGQMHLLSFHTVYPDIWDKELKEVGFDKVGPHCKETYKSTWYKWCKNGNFSKQYRGGREKVDATFRRDGAYDLLVERFSALEGLNDHLTTLARREGRIVTMHGYPLMTQRTEWGEVLPTTPLSYFVQGTAGGCNNRAIVRFEEKLTQWRKGKFDAWMILPVHDEIVVDMPARGKLNLPRVGELRKTMELSGTDIGVPLRVAASWHPRTWREKVKCE